MKGTNCPLDRFFKGQFQLQCGIGAMARPGSNPGFSIKVTINLPSAWFIFLLSLVENEVTRAKGSSNLLTLDNTDKYICLLGGIVWDCEEPIKRGVLEGNGFSRYKSDASAFQYSKQILNISVSSTSEMRTR